MHHGGQVPVHSTPEAINH